MVDVLLTLNFALARSPASFALRWHRFWSSTLAQLALLPPYALVVCRGRASCNSRHDSRKAELSAQIQLTMSAPLQYFAVIFRSRGMRCSCIDAASMSRMQGNPGGIVATITMNSELSCKPAWCRCAACKARHAAVTCTWLYAELS
jgi:hypothetical protein